MDRKQKKSELPVYGICPINLLPHLNRIELVTYLVLSKFQGQNENSYPSIETITKLSGLSNKSISTAIFTLTKKGLLVSKRRYGKSSIYKLFYVVGEDIEQVKKELKEHNKKAKPKFLKDHDYEPPVHNNHYPPVHNEDEPSVHDGYELPVHQHNKNPLEKPTLKNPVCESPINIITRETELTGNTLGIGSYSNSKIKENIYKYLHSKAIPIVPGTDEPQIEKHKYSPEFIYKIQRLEKLHYLKTHWREWENWIDKTQLPIFQKLELQAGSISWALSNHSTDVDAPYNLIESFIKRREEEKRHKQAERERIEAERQEYYATLRDNPDEHQPPDTKTVYEKMADLKKQRAQESAVIQEESKQTERLTPEEQIRLRDLILQGRMNLEEQLEYKSLIERNRR